MTYAHTWGEGGLDGFAQDDVYDMFHIGGRQNLWAADARLPDSCPHHLR